MNNSPEKIRGIYINSVRGYVKNKLGDNGTQKLKELNERMRKSGALNHSYTLIDSGTYYPLSWMEELLHMVSKGVYDELDEKAKRRWYAMGLYFYERKDSDLITKTAQGSFYENNKKTSEKIPVDLKKVFENLNKSWLGDHDNQGSLEFVVLNNTLEGHSNMRTPEVMPTQYIELTITIKNYNVSPACVEFSKGFFCKYFSQLSELGASMENNPEAYKECSFITNFAVSTQFMKTIFEDLKSQGRPLDSIVSY